MTPDASTSVQWAEKIIWENILMDKMGFCETKVKSFVTRMWKCFFFIFRRNEKNGVSSTVKIANIFQKCKICFGQ